MSDQSATGEPVTAEIVHQSAAPAKTSERIESLDFIRGLAVMGILWANIVGFGQPMAAAVTPSAFVGPNGDPEGWWWVAQFVLIDSKMRGLFSILFGAGLYLFMERAWQRGSSLWLQVKRLMFLLLFGLIHYFFIWKGDILTGYAVWGLFGLLFITFPPQAKMAMGIAFYSLGALMWTGTFGAMMLFANIDTSSDPELAASQAEMSIVEQEVIADSAIETDLKQSGDYAGFVAHNFSPDGHLYDLPVAWLMMSVETWPLILIGMALYQFGFFSGGIAERKMKLWGWIGVIGGGLLTLAIGLWTKGQGLDFWSTNLSFVGFSRFPALPMALGMAALLVVYSPAWTGWLAERVRAAGRAAFTNYLGTSIVMLFVFHGWAFGLFGELNRPQLYGVAALTCGLMLLWSKTWLDRFRYGPLEWLWRCLTYGKLFALKR